VGTPALDLDLDAFEGPFDLLLTLILKEELRLAEVEVADIVTSFADRSTGEAKLDLEVCGEFLVLVGAMLEIKARELFPDAAIDLADLSPEEAAEELAERLEAYRRMKSAAAWLSERLAGEADRYFRLGPAPLAPTPELRLAPQEPEGLAAALRMLAQEPPQVSLAHMQLTFPPVAQFLERLRAVLRRRRAFAFEDEVAKFTRLEQA
jgi:segregation and condensation protein A